jgi:hypothetical protein
LENVINKQTDTNEKDHSSGENCDSTRNSRSSSNSSATNENNDFASQRKYEVSVEDEERFLRNLGWVPGIYFVEKEGSYILI